MFVPQNDHYYSYIPDDFPIEAFLKALRQNPDDVALHYVDQFYKAVGKLQHSTLEKSAWLVVPEAHCFQYLQHLVVDSSPVQESVQSSSSTSS
jgi:hypothetical protein